MLKKAGKKKSLKMCLFFCVLSWSPGPVLVIHLHVPSNVPCTKLKTRSFGFLIQMEASEIQAGLFRVADEISKERPRRLIKVVAGKKEKKEKIKPSTDTRNSTGSWGWESPETAWEKKISGKSKKKKNKEETSGFKGDCLTRSCKHSQIC